MLIYHRVHRRDLSRYQQAGNWDHADSHGHFLQFTNNLGHMLGGLVEIFQLKVGPHRRGTAGGPLRRPRGIR